MGHEILFLGRRRMKYFKNKVAVVTGAASGTGRGMAEVFSEAGMKVVLADVDETRLHATPDERDP
jgi:NADP-dependent 3-hydroxy acid dehydrogenase YdfG